MSGRCRWKARTGCWLNGSPSRWKRARAKLAGCRSGRLKREGSRPAAPECPVIPAGHRADRRTPAPPVRARRPTDGASADTVRAANRAAVSRRIRPPAAIRTVHCAARSRPRWASTRHPTPRSQPKAVEDAAVGRALIIDVAAAGLAEVAAPFALGLVERGHAHQLAAQATVAAGFSGHRQASDQTASLLPAGSRKWKRRPPGK